MPQDYSTNEMFTQNKPYDGKTNVEAPIYKDLIKLLVHQIYTEKMTELKKEENLLDPDSSELYKNYKKERSRRDLMNPDHFEIIDERVFLECSIFRISIDQIKDKRIAYLKEKQKMEEEEKGQEEETKRGDPDLSFGDMECSDAYTR
jgi:hypothetical protein